MDFDFNEDQRLLQQALRDFLAGECPPAWVRAQWETDTGRDGPFWKRLAEVGVPGLLVPEAQGGLGMDETDLALLLEETGRAGLAEPVVATSVGVALLRELSGDLAAEWLPKVASGDARLAVGHAGSPFVADAHVADLLFLANEGALHAVPAAQVRIEAQPSVDGSQRLFLVGFDVGEPVAEGDLAKALLDAALDRGAFCSAAEALGVADRLIELAVEYATQREQFGVAIGSFQAVKHMLADVKVELEYARSHVYRAAHSVATAAPTRAVDVSMAKLAACDAANAAAKISLQVHGAIGYTYEQDVHVWMKRAWSLDLAYGDSVFHRGRLCAGVIDQTIPAFAFGYQPLNP
ncbi:MAG: acyl-CoA/acyl-ACP dehydrogenase [Deltaproteobacteria bacterium]|nr:acyl-CoA/acyl-ACP dehydrogenase [Deltaproteobacteria bacterium]